MEFQVAYDSVTGVACSSGRDEAIELDSFLGRCDSGWLSVLALRRAARKSAKRCREISLFSLTVERSFHDGIAKGNRVPRLMPVVRGDRGSLIRSMTMKNPRPSRIGKQHHPPETSLPNDEIIQIRTIKELANRLNRHHFKFTPLTSDSSRESFRSRLIASRLTTHIKCYDLFIDQVT